MHMHGASKLSMHCALDCGVNGVTLRFPRHCRDATDIVSPWTVTIINSAYRNLVDSFNVDVTIAVQRVIQGTVSAGTVPSNGQSSVPITLIVEADAGVHGLLSKLK